MDRKNSLRGHDGWLFSRNWIFGGYWLSINDLKWCQRPRGSTAFFWFFVSFLMSDSSKTNQSLTICTKTSPRSPEISNAILKQFSKRIEKVPFISILWHFLLFFSKKSFSLHFMKCFFFQIGNHLKGSFFEKSNSFYGFWPHLNFPPKSRQKITWKWHVSKYPKSKMIDSIIGIFKCTKLHF